MTEAIRILVTRLSTGDVPPPVRLLDIVAGEGSGKSELL